MEEDVEKVLRSQKPGNRFDKRETRGETSIGRAFWACAMCERATHHRWILYLWIEQEEIKKRPERGRLRELNEDVINNCLHDYDNLDEPKVQWTVQQ